MNKINTVAIMAATSILGYGFYNQQMENAQQKMDIAQQRMDIAQQKMENADLHKKMDLLVDTNTMTHESLMLETHNRKKMGEQMMAYQTQYQENAVALNAVGNLKNQLKKISTWTDDLIKPELVWKKDDGFHGSTKEVYLGGGHTFESCNQACLKSDWCTHFQLGITSWVNCCWIV